MAKESKQQSSAETISNFIGERVALGTLREDLLPLYGRWINDLDTMRMMGLPPGPVTAEKERAWQGGRSKWPVWIRLHQEPDRAYTITACTEGVSQVSRGST